MWLSFRLMSLSREVWVRRFNFADRGVCIALPDHRPKWPETIQSAASATGAFAFVFAGEGRVMSSRDQMNWECRRRFGDAGFWNLNVNESRGASEKR